MSMTTESFLATLAIKTAEREMAWREFVAAAGIDADRRHWGQRLSELDHRINDLVESQTAEDLFGRDNAGAIHGALIVATASTREHELRAFPSLGQAQAEAIVSEHSEAATRAAHLGIS